MPYSCRSLLALEGAAVWGAGSVQWHRVCHGARRRDEERVVTIAGAPAARDRSRSGRGSWLASAWTSHMANILDSSPVGRLKATATWSLRRSIGAGRRAGCPVAAHAPTRNGDHEPASPRPRAGRASRQVPRRGSQRPDVRAGRQPARDPGHVARRRTAGRRGPPPCARRASIRLDGRSHEAGHDPRGTAPVPIRGCRYTAAAGATGMELRGGNSLRLSQHIGQTGARLVPNYGVRPTRCEPPHDSVSTGRIPSLAARASWTTPNPE